MRFQCAGCSWATAAAAFTQTDPCEARRLSRLPYAPEIDDVLHHERLRGGAKRLHRRNIDELPDGAFAAFDQTAFAIQGDTLLRWTPNGYHGRKPRPHRISVDVLTPPAILAVLSAGYTPQWHQSAKEWPLSVARPGQCGSRASRSGLRLVYRGLRYARSEGG